LSSSATLLDKPAVAPSAHTDRDQEQSSDESACIHVLSIAAVSADSSNLTHRAIPSHAESDQGLAGSAFIATCPASGDDVGFVNRPARGFTLA
jgi:hypothetical protein